MRSTDSPSPAVEPAAAAPVAAPAPGPVLAPGESARTVRLPGYSLLVRSRDRAPRPAGADSAAAGPAFFVHGLGGSSQNWSALMAALAGTVQGEALDLPGFGHSPPPDDGNYSIAGHARAVVRLLDRERRGPVHLFGNSLGGAVAVKVAAARPDLVGTLTLVSPALPEVPPQLTAWPTGLISVPGLPQLYMRATRGWTPERRTSALMALIYGDPALVGEPVRLAAVREYQRRLELPYFWDVLVRSTRGIVDAYTLSGQHALWRQAERVLAPTLLVYGGRDKLVSARTARRAATTFRDVRQLLIPDSGHVAMMEHPELVARAFRDLLEELAHRDGAAGTARTGTGTDAWTDPGPGTAAGPTSAAATGS
ncbi:alpha/beta hydrolase [Streptomyces sp. V4-01]|uniref:Alpha/beta hydrolase n=1 Tax=Actinacidiphila polyblastidii TaxID=3110430 RepID=A0ABU7PKC5_9ACTN|nr:alpha/beta hydrolase [Streptomyces sp. V4-01]